MKQVIAVAGCSVLALTNAPAISAHTVDRYPGADISSAPPFVRRVHTPLRPAPRVRITAADRARARAGGWLPVTAPAPFAKGAAQMLLLTDGTVMIQDYCSTDWWSLTPDQNGSYVNGSWTRKASSPSGYAPLYSAAGVLADGKLIVIGGEYIFCAGADTNRGAVYDPVANTWTPTLYRFGEVGDAPSVVLSDGTFMVGPWRYNFQSFLEEPSLTFTRNGSANGKADLNSEEGWTLLPDGDVLTVDIADLPNSELYDPASRSWSSAGLVPLDVVQYTEIGPQVLRTDGTVFVIGASKYTARYDSKVGKWEGGPLLPTFGGHQLSAIDAPATLLPNGDVLFPLSANLATSQSYFFTYDGKAISQVAAPPNAPNDYAFQYITLLLPNGQVLVTDQSKDVEIYTRTGRPDASIAPVINSVPRRLTRGTTYTISGIRFNGFSQANMFGDDAQMGTNYPLVRIVNSATHHVSYARTHDHSYMGVASQMPVSTKFDVSATIETGPSKLEVVANGISSRPKAVTIY